MNAQIARLVAALACVLTLALQRAPSAATPDPVLVLVSIDGWRWDYIDRPQAPRLRALASRGIHVRELIPSFPTLTFPNHYTLVTGLYPEHHGMVGNAMIDPATGRRFSMRTAEKNDPMWWGGEPLWITAARQGRRTAALFWPGSEGEIQGMRPTYWQRYDTTVPAAARIRQAIDWLRLPADQRPSLIAIYLEDIDHAGHDFGPDSPQLSRAARLVDRNIGVLADAIASLHLDDRTTIVVVSDHGMSALSDARVILLDDYLDVSTVDVTEWDGVLMLEPKPRTPAAIAEIYKRLEHAHPRLHVYTRETLPPRLHYSDNPRIAPIIGILDDGWRVTTRGRVEQRRKEGRAPARGAHGYDPDDRDMHALFVAAGPDLQRGLVVPALANVNVYDFLCRVLRLTPAPNDGDAKATAQFFRR